MFQRFHGAKKDLYFRILTQNADRFVFQDPCTERRRVHVSGSLHRGLSDLQFRIPAQNADRFVFQVPYTGAFQICVSGFLHRA